MAQTPQARRLHPVHFPRGVSHEPLFFRMKIRARPFGLVAVRCWQNRLPSHESKRLPGTGVSDWATAASSYTNEADSTWCVAEIFRALQTRTHGSAATQIESVGEDRNSSHAFKGGHRFFARLGGSNWSNRGSWRRTLAALIGLGETITLVRGQSRPPPSAFLERWPTSITDWFAPLVVGLAACRTIVLYRFCSG
jgi:hypothetical protein